MSNVRKLRNCANRLEDLVMEMDNLIEEAKEIVQDADRAGEEIGLSVYESFKAYIYAHLKIYTLGKEDSGYMSNNEGLKDLISQIQDAANELKEVEEYDED